MLECTSKELRTYLCECLCGARKELHASEITPRHTGRVPHNGSPEYRAWQNAKARCYNPNHRSYPDYGGRGIKMCDQWRNNFAAFFADMGKRPSAKHSLDRRWNDGDYEPGNCRWTTARQQTRNRRPRRKVPKSNVTVYAEPIMAL